MKLWPLAALPLVAASWLPSSAPVTVVIGGEFNGYLSPCGCSEPMMGGLNRLGGLVNATRQAGKTLVVLNGPITSGLGRQSELKAETVAQSVRLMAVSGFNLTSQDSRLGVGTVSSMQSLSGGKLVSTSVSGQVGRAAGYFWITGASARGKEIATNLGEEEQKLGDSIAQSGGRPVIVLFEGDLAGARQIAARYSQVGLVVYSAQGKSPASPAKEGSAWLVHPGERGTSALRLVWHEGRWTSYQSVPLGPETPRDLNVDRVFNTYLDRVDQEGLIEQMVRSDGPEYAGSKMCMTCHAKAADIWRQSKHAAALATLEREHHDRDPDCISCHVVDIHKSEGFRSRTDTPNLADVGCESCHGPGGGHAKLPQMAKMPKIGNESCMKCHTVNNSPKFDFGNYWPKVAH